VLPGTLRGGSSELEGRSGTEGNRSLWRVQRRENTSQACRLGVFGKRGSRQGIVTDESAAGYRLRRSRRSKKMCVIGAKEDFFRHTSPRSRGRQSLMVASRENGVPRKQGTCHRGNGRPPGGVQKNVRFIGARSRAGRSVVRGRKITMMGLWEAGFRLFSERGEEKGLAKQQT